MLCIETERPREGPAHNREAAVGRGCAPRGCYNRPMSDVADRMSDVADCMSDVADRMSGGV
jgi:hypothetical protein